MAKKTDPLATVAALPHVADDQELQELLAKQKRIQNQLVDLNARINSVDAELSAHDPSVSKILESAELGDVVTDLAKLESDRAQLFKVRDAAEGALARLSQMIQERRQAAARELGRQAYEVMADQMVALARAQVAVFDAQATLMDLIDELQARGATPADAGLPGDLSFFCNASWWQAPSSVGRFAMASPVGADLARTWFVSAFARVVPQRETEIHKLVK